MFTHKNRSGVFGVAAIAAAASVLAAQPAASADFPIGSYASSGIALAFDGSGQFHVSQGAAMKVEGKYTVDADQLHFTDTRGPWACAGEGSKSGTYHWKADHATLTFSKVDDACKERVDSLTTHPWTKQS